MDGIGQLAAVEGVSVGELLAADAHDRARHHHRRQHDDPDVGRADRSAGHRGLPRRDRVPPVLQGGHLGPGAAGARTRSPGAASASRSPSGSRPRVTIETPLDEEAVRKAVARLRGFGVTSIAVCFLHSYLNPVHEVRAGEIVRDEYPDVEMISLSHQVLPEAARVRAHLDHAGQRLRRAADRQVPRPVDRPSCPTLGYEHDLLVATSAGGVATAQAAAQRGVATIGSGPTGGVSAAAERGRSRRAPRRRQRRHGRHQLRRVPDPRRSARHQDGLELAASLLHRDPDGRHRLGRCRRRIDHLGRRRRAAGRPAVGRQPARARSATAAAAPQPTSPTRTWCWAGSRRRASPTAAWSSTSTGARRALTELGDPLGLDAEQTAAGRGPARRRAHDRRGPPRAVARRCRPAASRPRRVRRHGRRARHDAGRGARDEHRASCPGPRRACPPSGCSPPTTSSTTRAATSRRGRPSTAMSCNDSPTRCPTAALAELRAAGVPDERIELKWSLLMVYPGQTFDVAIGVDAPTDVEAGRGRVPSPQRGGPPHRGPAPGAGRARRASDRHRPRRRAVVAVAGRGNRCRRPRWVVAACGWGSGTTCR